MASGGMTHCGGYPGRFPLDSRRGKETENHPSIEPEKRLQVPYGRHGRGTLILAPSRGLVRWKETAIA